MATKYQLMYRLGFRPWEGYREAAHTSVDALLDREEAERPAGLGRALDLGCGRGQYTPELARRGWEAVGVDVVEPAIRDARAADPTATYVVGDVTRLDARELGTFDFFLEVGCFQGLSPDQRAAMGRSVTALANPGATLLSLCFGPRLRWLVEGASRADVESAYPGWEVVADDPADTAGLGWPMNRAAPRWFRLRRR
jgi:SAM-dependent methyltransferase